MSGVASVLLALLLIPAAPVPPDRKVPTVRTIVMRQRSCAMPDPESEEWPAEFFKKCGPWHPQFKTFTTVEELCQQFGEPNAVKDKPKDPKFKIPLDPIQRFSEPNAVKEELADKFDPKRHVILFARWSAWLRIDSLRIGRLVDGNKVVLFEYAREEQLWLGCGVGAHRTYTQHTAVFVIDKEVKWRIERASQDASKRP